MQATNEIPTSNAQSNSFVGRARMRLLLGILYVGPTGRLLVLGIIGSLCFIGREALATLLIEHLLSVSPELNNMMFRLS
jgi:hypothetical protein